MTVVIDSSVAFAALLPDDENAEWSRNILASGHLVGPELLVIEVSHLLRRSVRRGALTEHDASGALADFLDIMDVFVDHVPLVPRMWELHSNVTSYDAVYVALAEALGAPLATLDQKLRNATGPRCDFLAPA
jgi:predicted nucleic acid-binding protein